MKKQSGGQKGRDSAGKATVAKPAPPEKAAGRVANQHPELDSGRPLSDRRMAHREHGLLRAVVILEDGVLVLMLTGMIVLAVLQIFLRNFFESGIFWADSLLRLLVLWIALWGGMIASRNVNHISIDIISRYLTPIQRKWTNSAVRLATAAIAAIVAWQSFLMVQAEYGEQSFIFEGMPAWFAQSIIPFAFSVIALRFLVRAFVPPKPSESQTA